MSGNVVAWVFKNYPITTPADRNRKLVLAEVAEAANRDGENAHPGVGPIAHHWGFDAGTVRRHLSSLVADGWLEVTEEGGGRGNATVYRVCTERVAACAGFSRPPTPETRAIASRKRAHSAPQTRAIAGSVRITHPRDTPEENTLADASASEATLFPIPAHQRKVPLTKNRQSAIAIAKDVWARRRPKPMSSSYWPCVDRATEALDAGDTIEQVTDLCMKARGFSVGAVEFQRTANGEHEHEETATERSARLQREGMMG